VWLIEDLHWAEPDLLAFFDVAVTGAASRAILCTTRPALVERVPEWCSERPDQSIRRLDLEPLEPLDAGTLVRRLVGDALAPGLVERIVVRSDGNALFIEELLRSWISVGMLVSAGDEGWRLSGPPDELSLPSTVQAIYAAQLDDLPASARRLARRASVAGRRFVEPSLAALDSVSGEALEELRSRALLVGPQEALLGATYAYRHVLLRDAGYASLARLERADLHVRLARWLEQAAGDRAALIASEIAQHYAQALDALPALGKELPFGGTRADLARVAAAWLERAAEQALRTVAHQAAAALLRQALELTPDDDHPARARRWLRLAEAIGFTGDMDEALAALVVPIELYEALLDSAADGESHEAGPITVRDGYARAVALRGTLRIEQLQFKEAEALADRALQHLDGNLDDLAAARLLHLRAWARMAYSADADAEGDLERARAIASTAGERQLEFQAGTLLADLKVDRGEVGPVEFLAGRRRMFELAIELGEFRRAGSALRTLALTHAEQGGREAADLLAEALQLAEAHGLTEEVAWCHYASTEVALVTGDWDAAWRNGLRALEIGERHAYHRPIVRTWFALTAIAHAQGRTDEMVRAFAWFDLRRHTFPDSPFGRVMHGAVDTRAAAFGLCPVFVAPDSLLDAWDETPGLPSWYAAIELVLDGWLNAGRHELVTAAVTRMQAWEQFPLTSALARATTDLVDARLKLAVGAVSAASGLAERSLGFARTVGAPWWIGKALRTRQLAGEPLSAEELAEVTAIERRLGLPRPWSRSSRDGDEAPRQPSTS
jgi:tetratricopeptide (TPR) repeat protein